MLRVSKNVMVTVDVVVVMVRFAIVTMVLHCGGVGEGNQDGSGHSGW